MRRTHDWKRFADCVAESSTRHADDFARWADAAARHAERVPSRIGTSLVNALHAMVDTVIDRVVDADTDMAWRDGGEWSDER
jgi:hypothetical protein